MKKFSLFLVTTILVLGLCGSSMAAISYGGSNYQFVYGNLTWDDANIASGNLGPGWRLATITSQGEQDFLSGILGTQNGLMWVGGIQFPVALGTANLNWNWVTGEDFYGFQAWATAGATEPNDWNGIDERYLAMDGRIINGDARNWTWNDGQNTDAVLGYIAEDPTAAVPEPSTLMLLGSGLVSLIGYGRRRMKK